MQLDYNNIIVKYLYFFKLVPTTMRRYYLCLRMTAYFINTSRVLL